MLYFDFKKSTLKNKTFKNKYCFKYKRINNFDFIFF